MRLPTECYQMQQTIEHYMPHLERSQIKGLVLWVYGTVLARSSCQNAVVAALLVMGNWNSLRQYLREWLYDGCDRASPCHVQLDVRLCFVPLFSLEGPYESGYPGSSRARPCGRTRELGGESPGLPDLMPD